MTEYPSTFVMPSHTSYTGAQDSGLLRSAAPFPEPNQISTYNAAVINLSLTFSMTSSDYETWAAWVRENAYDWFIMPVVSPHRPDYIVGDSRVRFISDTSYNYNGYNWVTVGVSAELVLNDESINGATPTYLDFIVSGSPALPATDVILAGTIASPATDIIVADLYAYDFVRQ